MPESSFGGSKIPNKPHGFNSVDMVKKSEPVPPEPVVEQPPEPPKPPINDPTEDDSASGGDRIGAIEHNQNLIKELLVKLFEWIGQLLSKWRN